MRFSIFQLAVKDHFRLVVVGGGTAGCAVASNFARKLPKHEIALIEPQKTHYYQPGFTLAAVGLMNIEQLQRDEFSVLPRGLNWFQDSVQHLCPESNKLLLENGQQIFYDFLVLATGIELRFDLIEGLPAGRESVLFYPSISSIYFLEGAKKTFEELNKFPSGGVAIFTFPSTPIKCAGAPQKICYLAEEILRRKGIRSNCSVHYYTALGRIFGVPKYAASLERIVRERGIEVHPRHNLAKVDPEKRQAVFDLLDEKGASTGEQRTVEYSFLHIGAPCSPVKALREHAKQSQQKDVSQLTDSQGWVKVDPCTLQSPVFQNVFAIGDCTNTPNAKTAAAISSQFKALAKNLENAMADKKITEKYDGYASCPLVVDRRHVILAEFSPNGPLETFPFDQSRPTIFAYLMKRYLMPPLYWRFLLNGYWKGPATLRKIFHLFSRRID